MSQAEQPLARQPETPAIDELPLDVFSGQDDEPEQPRTCPWCGAEFDAGVEACPVCGSPAARDDRDAGVEPRKCQWCSAELVDGAEFCPGCGSPVADPDQQFPGLSEPYPGEREIPQMRSPVALDGNPAPGLLVDAAGQVASAILRTLLRG